MINSTIAVVIPSSRSSQTLLKSVQSVLNQTLIPNEIIVIRNSFEVIELWVVEAFNDNGIILIDVGKPIGVSSARNIGIRHARSAYVAFLDDDDEWLEDKLEIQMKHMLLENLMASTTNFYFESRGKRRIFPEQSPSDVFRNMALRCHCGPGSTLVITRELISSLGMFKDELSRYEDWHFMTKLTAGGHNYKHLGVITAVVNKTEASWMNNSAELFNLTKTLQEFNLTTRKELSNGITFEKAVNEKRAGRFIYAFYSLFKWILDRPSNIFYLAKRLRFKMMNYFSFLKTKDI